MKTETLQEAKQRAAVLTAHRENRARIETENRAAAYNRAAEYINETAPELLRELLAGYSLKVDGTLHKKDRARFDAILSQRAAALGPHGSAYLDFGKYSVWLKVRTWYTFPAWHVEHGPEGATHSRDVYLLQCAAPGIETRAGYDPQRDRVQLITADTLRAAAVELRDNQEKQSALQSRAAELKRLTEG